MAGLGVLAIGAGVLFMFAGASDRWVVDVIKALIDGKSIGTVPASGGSHFGPFVTGAQSGSGAPSQGGPGSPGCFGTGCGVTNSSTTSGGLLV